MKLAIVLFALVATALGQKSDKSGKPAKSAYVASSPGPSHYSPSSSYGGNPGGYNGATSHHAPSNKNPHAALVSDIRSLNHDGSINYNFAANNGLQQGETVDADGTRRGFYSYPGADGKQITVKYTAGKNGFIAEGDHLPRQPQAAPHSAGKDESYSAPKTQGGVRSQHRGPPSSYGGSFGPGPSSFAGPSPYGGGRPHGGRASAPPQFGGGFSSEFPSSFPSRGIQASPSPYAGAPRGGNSFSSFGGPSIDFSPQGFGGPSPSGSHRVSGTRPQHYNGGSRPSHFLGGGPSHAPQRYNGGGSSNSNSFGGGGFAAPPFTGGFSADNPYTPQGAGPFAGDFNLGNGGHFSINFEPGQAQQYSPGGAASSEGFGGIPHNSLSSQRY